MKLSSTTPVSASTQMYSRRSNVRASTNQVSRDGLPGPAIEQRRVEDLEPWQSQLGVVDAEVFSEQRARRMQGLGRTEDRRRRHPIEIRRGFRENRDHRVAAQVDDGFTPGYRDALDDLLEPYVVDPGVVALRHPFHHHRVAAETESGTVEVDELEGPHIGAAGAGHHDGPRLGR